MQLSEVLNEEQLAAVTNTDGPVLVLAGAGSGKTRVLTHKVAYLLARGLAKPWEILAVTFTNKAAGEMKGRIQDLVRRDIQHMWVGTFHSLFARILRRHAEMLGYTANFAIYDREDQLRVIKEVLNEMPTRGDVLPPKRALGIISSIKSGGERTFDHHQGILSESNIEAVFDKYEKKLRKYGAFDFDDLLVKPLKLFNENEDIANLYRERFSYILVDEFQDTNLVQNELLKVLWQRHRNITVV